MLLNKQILCTIIILVKFRFCVVCDSIKDKHEIPSKVLNNLDDNLIKNNYTNDSDILIIKSNKTISEINNDFSKRKLSNDLALKIDHSRDNFMKQSFIPPNKNVNKENITKEFHLFLTKSNSTHNNLSHNLTEIFMNDEEHKSLSNEWNQLLRHDWESDVKIVSEEKDDFNSFLGYTDDYNLFNKSDVFDDYVELPVELISYDINEGSVVESNVKEELENLTIDPPTKEYYSLTSNTQKNDITLTTEGIGKITSSAITKNSILTYTEPSLTTEIVQPKETSIEITETLKPIYSDSLLTDKPTMIEIDTEEQITQNSGLKIDLFAQSEVDFSREDTDDVIYDDLKSHTFDISEESVEQSIVNDEDVVDILASPSIIGNSPMEISLSDILNDEKAIHNLASKAVKPGRRQSSLAFVFDSTGSMWNELQQLKEGAEKIMAVMKERDDKPIYNYVLIPFHDPKVGPITVTDDDELFRQKLSEIDVFGGGDCPEMSLGGIRKAIEVSLPRSYIYVFTDATSADHYLVDGILDEVQRKESQVVFVLTGDCGNRTVPGYTVYEKIAHSSSGQIFHLDKDDVNQVLDFVRNTLDTRRVSLLAVSKPKAVSNEQHSVKVDESLKQFMVSVSGDNPRINITNPSGEVVSLPPKVNSVLNLDKIKVVNVVEPEVGQWAVSVGSDSDHTVRLTGLSDLKFDHGFSIKPTNDIDETNHRPMQGAKNYLLVKPTNNSVLWNVTSAELSSLDGQLITKIPLYQSSIDNEICLSEQFLPPNEFFHLTVNGFGINGNPFQRTISTAIKPQLPDKPFVTTDDKISHPIHIPLKLRCHVESLVPIIVRWFKDDTPISDAIHREQSGNIYWENTNPTLDSAGRYTCMANNAAGQSERNVYLEMNEPPQLKKDQKSSITIAPGGSIQANCIAIAGRPPPVIEWIQNNVALKTGNGIEIYENKTLFIRNVTSSHKAVYQCLATNNAGVDVYKFDLKVQASPMFSTSNSSSKYSGKAGETLVLQCEAQGEPKPLISWIKDGSPVNFNKDRYRNEDNSLVFSYLRENDAGVYVCTAFNTAGSLNKTMTVVVTVPPKILPIGDDTIKIIEGQLVSLACPVSGNPTPVVQWLVNSTEISMNNKILDDENTLKFIANLSDTGQYKCVASNDIGSTTRDWLLVIFVQPSIYPPEDEIIKVTSNKDVVFSCKTNGFPHPSIRWKKDELFLYNTTEISIYGNGDLMIYEPSFKSAGDYICVAINEAGIARKTFNLIIHVPPKILDNVTTDIKLVEGEDYSIPCTVEGNPVPYITWTKDGKILSKDEIYVDSTNTLILMSVTKKSAGIYKCEAVNFEGSNSRQYFLDVMVPPFMDKTGPFNINVREGDSIILECPHTKAFPPPTVVWKKDSYLYEKINNELSTTFETTTKKTLSDRFLKIDEVTPSDSGKYECTAINPAGKATGEFTVTVLRSPTIREARDVPKQVVRRVGEVVRMNCEAEGYPPPKIYWRRGGEIVGNGHILEINNIQSHHKDYYVCRAVNSVGKKEQKFYLDVLEPPTLINPLNETVEVIKSGNIKLSCHGKGHPQPNYKWEIPSSVREELISFDDKDAYLFDANIEQEGLYTCKVHNPVGYAIKTFNVTVVEPPVIERVPRNGSVEVKENENFQIECYVQGNPKVTVKWYHNGKLLTEDDFQRSHTARVLKASENVWKYILTARDVTIEHGGQYSCVGVNKIGHNERDFNVSILMAPRLTNEHFVRKTHYLEGLPISLQCIVIGNPDPIIVWLKNNNIIYDNDTSIYIEPNGETLYIDNAQINHVGSYRCIARNDVGEINRDFEVNVLVAPRITETSPAFEKHIRLVVGDTLRLNCDAIGNPLPDILWIKSTNLISNVEYEHDNKTMVLHNVTLKDSGQYSCVAINLAGAREFNFDVFIQEPPHILRATTEPPDLNIKIYRPFVLHCDVGGTPEPNITWYKDDVLIVNTPNRTELHISSDGSRFQIMNALLSDAGKYLCNAENSAGIIQQSYPVQVTIPAEWSAWSDWSICSASCGPGLRFRRRSCNYGVELDENEIKEYIDSTLCSGLSTETESCQMVPCPIHGGWSLWTEWTPCSEKCGKEATRKRYRYCNSPQPSFGGHTCPGDDYEQEYCDLPYCPIDGQWSEWTDWTPCSVTCGRGLRTRQRKCNNPKPAYGGASCKGSNQESKECNIQPCPVDGGWTEWSPWSPCSQSCGSSSKVKHRTCTNPTPQFGGKYCIGENLMIEKCDEDPCKIPPKHANIRVKGMLNGERITDNLISADISKEGETNTVSATGDNLLRNQSGWFPYLTFLVTPVSWNIAEQEEEESVGLFNQKSQVEFSTGQELIIKHVGRGKDKDGNIQIEIEVNGEVPIVQEEAQILIEPFSEEYVQTGPSTLFATANNNLRVDGRPLQYKWNNNVTYSHGSMPHLSERLSTKSIDMEYNPHSRKMRYVVSTAVQRDTIEKCPNGFQKDPVNRHCIDVDECEFRNGAGCHSTQLCENTFGSFRCYCQSGYKSMGNGRRCLDINECLQNIHQCSHECNNVPGGYECLCPRGMILASDSRTCIKRGYRNQNVKQYPEYTDPRLLRYNSFKDISQERTYEESSMFITDSDESSCPQGYRFENGKCTDINECIDGLDILCNEGQSCLNTRGSYFCIPIPCPEHYKRGADTSSCIQFCGGKNAPICSEGALVAQTVSYTMLTLSKNKIQLNQPILLLQMYSVDGKPLPINSYILHDSTSSNSFEVKAQQSKGVLTTTKIPAGDRVHRVTITGNSYDVDGKTLLYTTKYIIYIYIFD